MDNYLLNDGKEIYPIVKIKYDNKDYLFYSTKKENITDDDIFVAEELNNELLPVNDELLNILNEKFNEIRNNTSK